MVSSSLDAGKETEIKTFMIAAAMSATVFVSPVAPQESHIADLLRAAEFNDLKWITNLIGQGAYVMSVVCQ